jgi:large subunit ribosomal protein L9
VALHPEIDVTITVSVARSADEAERIARGEDVTAKREEAEESAEAALAAAEAFFENPEGAEKRLGGGDSGEEPPTSDATPAKD